jgi:hypothetical protein
MIHAFRLSGQAITLQAGNEQGQQTRFIGGTDWYSQHVAAAADVAERYGAF